MRESYDQVRLLGSPKVRPYIHFQKLVQSPLFREALTFATDHYKQCGDTRFIVELVKLYHHQSTKRLLTSHVRDHAGLHVTIEAGQVKLVKVIKEGADDRLAVAKKAKKTAPTVVVTVKKKRKSPKRVDLMAPWIRLPGHYGSKGR